MKKYWLLDVATVQDELRRQGFYSGPIDGISGPKTREALRQATPFILSSPERQLVYFQQEMMKKAGCEVGDLDGYLGPQTMFGLEQWQNKHRDINPTPAVQALQPQTWPTQNNVPDFFGAPGSSLVRLELPYLMRLSWDPKTVVRGTSVHSKVQDSLARVLTKVLEVYGKEITPLRLDLFGGAYNNRNMRGGTKKSMHAWGIALDFDPERNQLRWNADKASFSASDYAEWWKAWEEEGWVSLGKVRNFDWMHVQAARL